MYPIDTDLKGCEISSMLNERIRMDKDLLINLKKNSPMYEAYTRIVEVLEHMLSITLEIEKKQLARRKPRSNLKKVFND